MKIQPFSYIALLLLAILSACEKDNYDPPKSTLTGRVVYQDQSLGVRSNGVQLELWQPGYQLYSKIPVYLNQDGSFSASLFDGNYKLVLLRGNGPWVDNSDTLNVEVRGSAVVDVPVQPYYLIRNETFGKSGNEVTATCKVDQISGNRAVERVILYLGATQFVDSNNNVGRIEKSGTEVADLRETISFSTALPSAVANKGYCFARIAVKTVGVAEMLYTPVQKIQF
jgi:hypothetical protein